MISDDAVISVLQEFYRYGFRIEIDDFGKAQSTLPMLKLPFVDTVKLDKSLIDCIGDRKGEIMLRRSCACATSWGCIPPPRAWRPRIRWISCARGLHGYTGLLLSPPLPVENIPKSSGSRRGNGLTLLPALAAIKGVSWPISVGR